MQQNKDFQRKQQKQEGKKEIPKNKDPSPPKNKNFYENDQNPIFIQQLASFRSINANNQFIFPSFRSNFDMALIETPANNGNKASYLQQIDQGIKSISKIIAWTNDDDDMSNSLDMEEVQQFQSQSQYINCNPLAYTQQKFICPSINQDQQKSMEPYLRFPLQKSQNKRNFLKQGNSQDDQTNSQKKACNCKKTQCLKLYCDCFRENRKCEGCSCVGCHNTSQYETERKSAMVMLRDKNPEAFKPKIQSSLHTKGCNCKKSNCLKKYCQCYQAGLKCGDNCKCQECKNCQHQIQDKYNKYLRKNIPADFRLKYINGPSIIVPNSFSIQTKEAKNKK